MRRQPNFSWSCAKVSQSSPALCRQCSSKQTLSQIVFLSKRLLSSLLKKNTAGMYTQCSQLGCCLQPSLLAFMSLFLLVHFQLTHFLPSVIAQSYCVVSF